jgi:uncharacterized protein
VSAVTARPWAVTADGLIVAVRLTPKGGRDAIEGIDVLADGRAVLKARVRAVASEGEANTALISLLARAVGLPPRDIVLISGGSARIKRLKIIGGGAALAAALEKAAAVCGPRRT